MFKINSWYPILAFYETNTFHVLTAVPQFFLALESNVTMDSGTLGHLLWAKPAELHASLHSYPELLKLPCACVATKGECTQSCRVAGPCSLAQSEREMVVSASQLSSPFLHAGASPPRFFFSFSSLAQVLSRSAIKMTRISDMRCSIKILLLPSLLLRPYWNSINP